MIKKVVFWQKSGQPYTARIRGRIYGALKVPDIEVCFYHVLRFVGLYRSAKSIERRL